MEDWSLERSRFVYGLNKNDLHFLDITENGDLLIRLGDKTITFEEVIKLIRSINTSEKTYTSSFTLRIPQLITYQVHKLRRLFNLVIDDMGYKGEFNAVYPVKVNQRRDCVIPVMLADSDYGLEAGTKAELYLITDVIREEKHRLIICNGAKDIEYLKTIREHLEDGFKIGISIESLHEAKLIADIVPHEYLNLVLRIKPYLKVRGHWSHSAGRDSKFGLSIHDLLDVLDFLTEKGLQDSVTTILGHVGSQITAIEDFRKFSQFMTRVFFEIRGRGFEGLERIDFGGGLAIDYTSSHPQNMMELYARALVAGIQDEMKHLGIESPAPDIMVESGRGITALGSLVVVRSLEVRSVFPTEGHISSRTTAQMDEWSQKFAATSSTSELLELWNNFLSKTSSEEIRTLDGLRQREQLIGHVRQEVRRHIARLDGKKLRSDSIVESLWHPDHIVIGNFSVFNSIGDHVLVKQHFPILPIRDLHVQPETTVRLVDITCDSDGEISQFHRKGTGSVWFTRDYRPLTMPVQEMGNGIPVGYLKNIQGSYFIIALTGAYQDVIEMNHNLLGDLPDVEIIVNEDGHWRVRWVKGAESMEQILDEMGYFIDLDDDPYMSG